MKWLRPIIFFVAVAFFGFTFVNASWLAGDLPGRARLIANGGIAQDYRPGARQSACPARGILPPLHQLLEDTERSVMMANRMGADLIAIDLVRSADGVLVLFPDTDLSCRTEASGSPSTKTLAQLRELDLGYGYTADNGQTFPLRGHGKGLITTLDDVLASNPRAHFVYRFPGNDLAAVKLWGQAIKTAEHDARGLDEVVIGPPEVLAAAEAAVPGLWGIDPAAGAACAASYRLTGWTSLLPAGCQHGTMIAALDQTFTLWGWPNRLLRRLDTAGTRMLAVADGQDTGLAHATQLPMIPVSFHGAVLVDRYWTVGPALRPSLDGRTSAEADAAQARDEKGE